MPGSVPHGYPMLLDVSSRLIVIVGGGAVATRKAIGLLHAGATSVRVIATQFNERMPLEVERVTDVYRPEHLQDADLVFAATDQSDVNAAVVRDARAHKIWVNRADADDDLSGDFTVPAQHEAGRIAVMVSAGGNPALAAKVRDELAAKIEEKWVAMAEAMTTLRPWIRGLTASIEKRREIFRWLAGDEAMELLDTKGIDVLKERIERI